MPILQRLFRYTVPHRRSGTCFYDLIFREQFILGTDCGEFGTAQQSFDSLSTDRAALTDKTQSLLRVAHVVVCQRNDFRQYYDEGSGRRCKDGLVGVIRILRTTPTLTALYNAPPTPSAASSARLCSLQKTVGEGRMMPSALLRCFPDPSAFESRFRSSPATAQKRQRCNQKIDLRR